MYKLFSAAAAAGILLFVTMPAGQASAEAMQQPPGVADREWRALLAGENCPKPVNAESYAVSFMRCVELSNIRLREAGLKFWQRHPDDPRRFTWLLLTVQAPPHYATNIGEWARNEMRLDPRPVPIDAKALQRWEKTYVTLREAFLASPAIDKDQRRLLAYTEVTEKVKRLRERMQPASVEDAQWLMDRVVAYAQAYQTPLSELDPHDQFAMMDNDVLYPALADDALFRLEPATVRGFIERLQATGHPNAVKAFQSGTAEKVRRQADRLNAEKESGKIHARLDERLGDRELGNGVLPEGQWAINYRLMIRERRYIEMGLQLLSQYPDLEESLKWLTRTQENLRLPMHIRNPVGATEKLVRDFLGARDRLEIDQGARQDWDRRYAKLKMQLARDPAFEKYRLALRATEYPRELERAAQSWAQGQDSAPVLALLKEAQTEDQRGHAGLTYLITWKVVRQPERYGLDEQALRDFAASLSQSSSDSTRDLVHGVLQQLDSHRTAVELKAPTLSGEPFDLSSLRGKIVLLDYWNTNCGSCIAAMPRIKAVYDRYQERGFEVVSLCFDATTERREVKRLESKLGATWTTLNTEGMWDELRKRYSYTGFPQYMLLDREGKLVAGTEEVKYGENLEALLQKLLTAESATTPST